MLGGDIDDDNWTITEDSLISSGWLEDTTQHILTLQTFNDALYNLCTSETKRNLIKYIR